MQAVPPILPLLNKETGDVIERTPERHANLVRFQAELEVKPFFERALMKVHPMPGEPDVSIRTSITGVFRST